MPTGRFAPSPTGPLHVGNLRTAVVAWLSARATGSDFLIRIEDLDRAAAREVHVRSHLADLAALGIVGDGEVTRQSERFSRYEEALARLDACGLLYPCYCTRREVQAAVAAPHGPSPEGAYPGTCRGLTPGERAAREAAGRRPSWRVRAGGERVEVVDRHYGRFAGLVDDFVVRRSDGVPAYQLAVVVDDHDQGIGEVVRGDDLLDSTPRQVWLARRLGLPVPAHAHVPLVLGPDGRRLAKRHGAVTLADLAARGVEPPVALGALAASLCLVPPGTPVGSVNDLVTAYDPERLPSGPWRFDPASPDWPGPETIVNSARTEGGISQSRF
ncbi:MAG TPA: tRNA glutamyl-Q(34) synthetase GluQRS [Acidimicrobiales bacterium]|nr:tRNA glutamyl-Q(34) synthetase GluQRS [Acidimicrobiales bacterium]